MVALLAVIASVSHAIPALASDHVERLASFEAGAGELPESLAIDRRGTIYVTLAPLGQVRAIAPDDAQRLVAMLPVGSGFGALGLAIGPRQDLYVAISTFDPATNGVYRIDRDGLIARLPGAEAIVLPNGLAFDHRGNLFVTDSADGAIWRVNRKGTAELWLRHPLLAGDNSAPPPVPLGANGIAFHKGTLFVTNTETGSVIRVPVQRDGSPDEPSILAQGSALVGADGLAIDGMGQLYVAVNSQSTVVRVSADGATVSTLATAADGLDSRSGVALSTGRRDRRTFFVVNFAIGPVFGFPAGAGPALLALDVGPTRSAA